MGVEFMFYNRRIEFGTFYVYELLQTNNGIFD